MRFDSNTEPYEQFDILPLVIDRVPQAGQWFVPSDSSVSYAYALLLSQARPQEDPLHQHERAELKYLESILFQSRKGVILQPRTSSAAVLQYWAYAEANASLRDEIQDLIRLSPGKQVLIQKKMIELLTVNERWKRQGRRLELEAAFERYRALTRRLSDRAWATAWDRYRRAKIHSTDSPSAVLSSPPGDWHLDHDWQNLIIEDGSSGNAQEIFQGRLILIKRDWFDDDLFEKAIIEWVPGSTFQLQSYSTGYGILCCEATASTNQLAIMPMVPKALFLIRDPDIPSAIAIAGIVVWALPRIP
jgi:hypothetical protein